MPRWTDEQLRDAVARNRNISQTLRALGLRPVGGNYDTIRRRIAELSLDTTHWRRSDAVHIDERELRAAVESSVSIAECLRMLGWPDDGARRQRFRALVCRHCVDTSHFLGQASNRGKAFPQFSRPVAHYLIKDGPYIRSSDLRLKLLSEGFFSHRCDGCGRERWRGLPIPLELDHINGDRYDNRLENLRLLCPNCHALTPTYRGRNQGRYVAAAP